MEMERGKFGEIDSDMVGFDVWGIWKNMGKKSTVEERLKISETHSKPYLENSSKIPKKKKTNGKPQHDILEPIISSPWDIIIHKTKIPFIHKQQKKFQPLDFNLKTTRQTERQKRLFLLFFLFEIK
jgi:hypothetical protein